MLEDAHMIDGIALTDEDPRRVALGIVDAGTTSDPARRMQLLLQKINSYLLAIGSGRLAEMHPGKSYRDFLIDVVCRTRPTPEMCSVGRVSAGADAETYVEVVFRPGPEAEWNPGDLVAEAAPPDEAQPSEEFVEIVNLAVGAGLRALQEGEPPLMLLWMQDGEADFMTLAEVASSEDLLAFAQKWAADAAPDIPVCAVVSLGMLPHESGPVHSLVALCAERGHPASFILAMPLDRDPHEPGVRARGEMFHVAKAPPIFPTPVPAEQAASPVDTGAERDSQDAL